MSRDMRLGARTRRRSFCNKKVLGAPLAHGAATAADSCGIVRKGGRFGLIFLAMRQRRGNEYNGNGPDNERVDTQHMRIWTRPCARTGSATARARWGPSSSAASHHVNRHPLGSPGHTPHQMTTRSTSRTLHTTCGFHLRRLRQHPAQQQQAGLARAIIQPE